jgi:hypothetical protein
MAGAGLASESGGSPLLRDIASGSLDIEEVIHALKFSRPSISTCRLRST